MSYGLSLILFGETVKNMAVATENNGGKLTIYKTYHDASLQSLEKQGQNSRQPKNASCHRDTSAWWGLYR